MTKRCASFTRRWKEPHFFNHAYTHACIYNLDAPHTLFPFPHSSCFFQEGTAFTCTLLHLASFFKMGKRFFNTASPSERAEFSTNIAPHVGAILFETFLYGIYAILFVICVYVLLRRNYSGLHWTSLTFAVTTFSLATSDIVYTYYLLFGKLLQEATPFMDTRPKYWLFITNNVLADALLLYRCYIIWECNKLVIFGPASLLIAGTACGYYFEGSTSMSFSRSWIYLTMTLTLNIILTSLIAGRIWWLTRQTKFGVGLRKRYNATIAILVESGCVYSLYVILDLGLRNNVIGSIVLDAGLIQVVGIMSTLIIVRVGLLRDNEASGVARRDGLKNPSFQSEFGTQLARSRSCRHIAGSSSDTILPMTDSPHGGNRSSGDEETAPAEMDVGMHSNVVEGLQELRVERAASLQLPMSWELGISTSPPGQDLGIFQQIAKTL